MPSSDAAPHKRPGLPLGTSDFRMLRREGSSYVDKSNWIREVIDGSRIQLYTRPRRFGKTLALSMLQYFFERRGLEQQGEDRSDVFDGLGITQPQRGQDDGQGSDDQDYRHHQQRYPVIALSFRSIKEPDWASCQTALRAVLVREITRLRGLGYLGALLPPEQQELAD